MRRTAIALPIAVMAAGLVLAAPISIARAAVGAIPTFHADIGYCISGQAASNGNQAIEITWRNGNGAIKAHFTTMTDQSGNWSASEAICQGLAVWPYDRLTAHVTGSFEQTRTFVVPNIDGTFDRATNVVRGHAPKHTSVSLYVYRGSLNDFDLGFSPTCQADRTADDSGLYRYDTTRCDGKYDAVGGDYANVQWLSNYNDSVDRTIVAPYLLANLHRSVVLGFTTPSTQLNMALRNASGNAIANAVATSTRLGAFSKPFTDGAGHAVTVEPTNGITGNWAGAVSIVVPQMALTVNLAANTVTGTCTPRTRYGLSVMWSNGGMFEEGRTDAQGSTGTVSPSPNHTLTSGDHIAFTCARPSGDRFRISRTVR